MKKIALASTDNDDILFFSHVAEIMKLGFNYYSGCKDLINGLDDETAVIWDIDANPGDNDKTVFPRKLMAKILKARSIPARRTFLVTKKSIVDNDDFTNPHSDLPQLSRNNLTRKYNELTAHVYGCLINASFSVQIPTISMFFPDKIKIQNFLIKKSEQRSTTVETIHNAFVILGLSDRLAAKVAQCADELLMNAIFDAPRDPAGTGTATRHKLDRVTKFDLSQIEEVKVELAAVSGEFAGISVNDNFGSIRHEDILKSLRMDYKDNNYQLNKDTPNAGLGLYGVMNSGISLLYSTISGRITRSMIFFPLAKSGKAFKESFQFLSYFGN